MKRLSRIILLAVLALMLMGLLAACANPIGARHPTGSNPPLMGAQPAKLEPANTGDAPADSRANDIEQALNDLDNQLKSTDTLDDLK